MYEGRPELAHRMSHLFARGELEPGILIRHNCDNPPCVNPQHLIPGTHADNMRDRIARGQLPLGEAHHNAKLSNAAVTDIRQRSNSGETGVALAREYGVSPMTISLIVRRKRWTHV